MDPVTIRLQAAAIIFIAELLSICALILTPANQFYYLVCGGFNLGIIGTLYFMPECDLSISLRRANMIALIVQFYGFLSYCIMALLIKFEYIETGPSWPFLIYNTLIHVINLLQIWIIFTKKAGDGTQADHSRLPLVRDPYPHWAEIMPKEKRWTK
jgi:hypothetical protein